jgi:thiamine kinase
MTDIHAQLKRFPVLADAEQIIELTSGLVNTCWRVVTPTGDYVVRINTPLNDRLGLDRLQESRLLENLTDLAIAPKPVATDAVAGVSIVEYLPGRSWNDADVRESKNLQLLGALLSRLHSSPVDAPRIDLAASAQKYAEFLGSEEAGLCATEVRELASLWCADRSRHALCHNDLSSGNIVDHANGLRLIDWEYAGLGEPYFDLAVVIQHHQLSAAAIAALFAGYGQSPDHERLQGCMAIYDRIAALWLMLVKG